MRPLLSIVIKTESMKNIEDNIGHCYSKCEHLIMADLSNISQCCCVAVEEEKQENTIRSKTLSTKVLLISEIKICYGYIQIFT